MPEAGSEADMKMSRAGVSQGALERLDNYVMAQDFAGYDPYDTLNTSIPLKRMGKWVPILATQVQKRNPINLRPVLGIKKERNPKGIGLFLRSYSQLYKQRPEPKLLLEMRALFEWLVDHASEGYSGHCWGYNFRWASPVKVVPAFHPSLVATSFVIQGIYEYYEATGDVRAKKVVESAREYVLNDLPQTETPEGICFSYTDIQRDLCYNATLLGAEILARNYAINRLPDDLKIVGRAIDFVVAHQHADGHWAYNLDPETGQERAQIDFHQGFVLDSLWQCMEYTEEWRQRWLKALRLGAEFYRSEQFRDNGRSRWRLPGNWPADIHHQAQGILTFTRLRAVNPNFLPFALQIAEWTIEHMQDPRGYFYYRKYRYYTNRIPFMRWGQAWMHLALTTLLVAADGAEP